MGLCTSPDIFHEKISKLFEGFLKLRACVYNLLVITKETFIDHIKALGEILQKLSEAGLKLNAEKSFFRQTKTKYLRFWLSNYGARPLLYKEDNIKTVYD